MRLKLIHLISLSGTSSFLKHDVASLVLRAPVGVLSPRVGGRPLTLTYFVSPYDLLDAEKKEVIPWSLDSLGAKKLGRRVAVAIEAIPPATNSSSSSSVRSDPNCHRLQQMALLTIKTNADGKFFRCRHLASPYKRVCPSVPCFQKSSKYVV